MITHYDPSTDYHPFLFDTKLQMLDDTIFINSPCKDTYPKYRGKACKIPTFWISELVISAHSSNILIGYEHFHNVDHHAEHGGNRGVFTNNLRMQ